MSALSPVTRPLRRTLAVLFAGLLLSASPAWGAPAQLPVQGVLLDNAGEPVADGAFAMVFALYSAGDAEVPVWAETWPADGHDCVEDAAGCVAVSRGVFSTSLGAQLPLDAGLFATHQQLWLGMAVEGEPELARQPLGSAAWAFHAASAGWAEVAGGLDCTGCVPLAALAGDVAEALAGQLPADALDEVSNGTLTNEFSRSYGASGLPATFFETIEVAIEVPHAGALRGLQVACHVTHPFMPDLAIELVPPGGAPVALLAAGEAAGGSLQLSLGLGDALPGGGSLADLLGMDQAGTWLLRVVDTVANGNEGQGEVLSATLSTDYLAAAEVGLRQPDGSIKRLGLDTFTVTGGDNLGAGTPLEVPVRNPTARPFESVRLDVWAYPFRSAFVPSTRFLETDDVDFADGAHDGTVVSGEGTVASVQVPLAQGDGRDGELTVSAGTVTLDVIRTSLSATLGSANVSVGGSAGFEAGQTVLLHQSRGVGAGAWQLTVVEAVGPASLTLADAAGATFVSSGDSRAQVLVVPQFSAITVAANATLTAPAWDGVTGGILALACQGTAQIAGTVTMSGRGYRGFGHEGQCSYRNQTGLRGEGHAGPGNTQSTANNGSGGGGGQGTQDAAGGAGGGHGSAGSAGGACSAHVGGAAGAAVGDPALTSVFFGGAGGEGGSDEDGGYPGNGGHGGGIVLVWAGAVAVTGAIVSDGTAGGGGSNCSCGSGSGMGDGGGGAGGTIALLGPGVSVTGQLSAQGGPAGSGCQTCGAGGAGAVGRVAVTDGAAVGVSTPAAAAAGALADEGGEGTYLSQVFDSGFVGTEITEIDWTATVPDGTSVALDVRAGQAPFDAEGPGPAWLTVAPGPQAGITGRYLQYRARLTAGSASPALEEVRIDVQGAPQMALGSLPAEATVSAGGVALSLGAPLEEGAALADWLDVTSLVNDAIATPPGVARLLLSIEGSGYLRFQVTVTP